MYITCQQCSTIFRLDEKLLKPSGSKVRCSQCSNIFVAHPPEPVDETPVESTPVMAPTSEAALDQELEGIDLAELDSILDQDKSSLEDGDDDYPAAAESEALADFDEADLDLDFEAALADDEEIAPPTVDEAVSSEADELDLDMDFNLNGEEGGPAGASPEPIADALAMEAGGDQAPLDVHDELGSDIDMVLDDFEDALGQPETGSGDTAEISDEDFDLDFELEAEPADSIPEVDNVDLMAAEVSGDVKVEDESDDLGLDDLGAMLDEKDDTELTDIEELELSLDDNDALDLDEAPADGQATPAETGDDLDLGDLDALLEGDDDSDEPDVEDMELSLDDGDDFILDEAAPVEDTPIPESAGDDLDLGDLDSLLDGDDDGGAEDADIEDVELSLDDSADSSVEQAPVSAEAPAADDLDLGDLDELLDAEDTDDGIDIEDVELSLDDGPIVGAASDKSDSIDDDDLGLGDLDDLLGADDTDGETDSPEAELSLEEDSDGLDLSDLNSLLDEDEAPADESDELDLSLELDSSEGEAADKSGGLEDLEFELDSEFEDKSVSQTADAIEPQVDEKSSDEELDLTDIEQMLEDDTLVQDGAKTGMETDTEKWIDDEDDDLGLGGDGEIDLSEIEEAIDAADTEIDGSGLLDDDDGLELDLDLDADPADTDTGELDLQLEMESDTEPMTLEEDDDELDLSDLDLSVEDPKASTTTETIDAGDIELEFQVEEDAPLLMTDDELDEASASTTAAASGTTTEAADTEDFSLEETIATEPIRESGPAKPARAPKKKGASKSLIVILILALLGGGGYFGYDYVKKNNIDTKIPFLNELINPQPKDPTGTMNLSTLEINSKFLENEKSGRLFIVTGKVRNGYSDARKMIRLRGKLFTKGKVLSKTEHTYAGVMVPDQELASMGLVDIKKKLNASLGDAAAVQVNAGRTIPFMVVFSELPDDLDEFAIELVSAAKIQ